jgi:hypothetical protein
VIHSHSSEARVCCTGSSGGCADGVWDLTHMSSESTKLAEDQSDERVIARSATLFATLAKSLAQAPASEGLIGGSVWESNPPVPAKAATPTDLKSARVTGPRALPPRIMARIAGAVPIYRLTVVVLFFAPSSRVGL